MHWQMQTQVFYSNNVFFQTTQEPYVVCPCRTLLLQGYWVIYKMDQSWHESSVEECLWWGRDGGDCGKSCFCLSFLYSCPVSSVFHSFRCPKSYANVQQVLCGNCSVCRWIICVLMKSNKFCILLFCYLDSSVVIFLSALVVKTIFLFFFFFFFF